MDAEGRVLGLNTSALLRGNSMTVPSATLKRVVDTLLSHGRIRRGYLGVGTQPVRLPPDSAQELGQDMGLLVVSVEPDSPAQQGGLFLGDTIVTLHGQPVRGLDDLLALLADHESGSSVAVRIVRGGQLQEMGITVGERSQGRR